MTSNTVCPDISHDEEPRKSHFPCYSCIKSEARAELEAKARAHDDALAKVPAVLAAHDEHRPAACLQ